MVITKCVFKTAICIVIDRCLEEHAPPKCFCKTPFGLICSVSLTLAFPTVFYEQLQKNLHDPLLFAFAALPSDMAAFHQQSREEELKGVSPSENTDVISGHDHCIQAQPEAGNHEAGS